jgi:hypothetical protein
MGKKRKHAKAEIAALLAQADDLAIQGKLQSEIARTLGISVMTLHRRHPRVMVAARVATHAPDVAPQGLDCR